MFFVLSTGRAGSRTISNLLSQCSDALCLHEPVPYLVEETAAYRYGELPLESLVAQLRETRPQQMGGRTYGESNNRLSLAVPALVEAFPDARFIWLTRDGRDVVASGHQRGWFDSTRIRDTVWERNRLRADHLGEMSNEKWEELPPFDRVCWLWNRTNEIIRDDLNTLDPDRWRHVRLEDLDHPTLDDLAEFLEISAPANWAIPQLNARTTTPNATDTRANRVARVIDSREWNDSQSSIFTSWCGDLMDLIYSGWQAGTPDPARDAEGDPALAEIRHRLAELSVIHGQLDRAVESQARAERKIRVLQETAASETSARDKAGRASAAAMESLRTELADVQSKLTIAQAEAAKVRASVSYQVGHRLVRFAKLPLVAIRAARQGARRLINRVASLWSTSVRVLVVQASKRPGARRVAKHLPESFGRRAIALSSGSKNPRKKPSQRNSSNTKWTMPCFGLNAVVGTGIDPAWLGAVEVVDPMAGSPTHLDLCLTSNGSVPANASALVDDLHTTVVAVSDRLAPLRPGLNPLGFHREHNQKFLAIRTGTRPVPPISTPPGRIVEVVDLDDLPNPSSKPDEFRKRVQSYLGLLDVHTLHDENSTRARMLVDVAACGLPVACTDALTLVPFLPSSVAESFAATEARTLTHEVQREQWSRVQRRIVLEAASPRAIVDQLLCENDRPGIRQPSVTVTIASNRPAMIPVWAGQLAAQSYADLEVVAALHGEAFSKADVDHAQRLLGERLTVCRVPQHHSLGEALNTAAAAAGGELLVKWDDDDLYDVDHVGDLVQAREYSGATLVGKAAEFAYLAGLDITVRRLNSSAEAFSPTICGATLSIARSDLRDLGGWRRSRSRVDSLLIEDVQNAGGNTYRTSGFGFMMLRARGDKHHHTWTADDSYFLRGAIDQRRGLDTAFAAIRGPESVHQRWGRAL